jgi:hypothetical protein
MLLLLLENLAPARFMLTAPKHNPQTMPDLLLLVDVCDPLRAAAEEAGLAVQLHHGLVPLVELVVAHVVRVNKAPLAPAGDFKRAAAMQKQQ